LESGEALQKDSPGQQPAASEPGVSLLDLLVVIAKRKWLVVAIVAGAIAIAVVVVLLLPPTYTATARVIPSPQGQSQTALLMGQLGALNLLSGTPLGGRGMSELYAGMLKSDTVADRLIERYSLKEVYGLDTLSETRVKLAARTRVRAGRDGIVAVEVDDRDASRAAGLANGYVEELTALARALALGEASQRRLFFETQVERAKQDLTAAEMAFRGMQEKTGLIQMDEQGRAMIGAVARLQAEVMSREIQLSAIRLFATEQNAQFRMVQEEVSALRAQLRKLERSSETSDSNFLFRAGSVPGAGLEYVRRLRELKYREGVYELLARHYEVARVDEAGNGLGLQVLDRAVVPDRRSRPRRGLVVAVTAVAAMVTAVLLALVIDAASRAQHGSAANPKLEALRRHLRA
jgi:uncharacterized protein involved in exopolysaccharide biosynthesis